MERDGLGLWRISTHLRDEYRMARSGRAAMRLVRHAYRKAGCAPKYLAGWSAERVNWSIADRTSALREGESGAARPSAIGGGGK